MNETQIFQAARAAWQRMAPARQRRRRYCRFTFGRQWDDPATDRQGRATTEGALAAASGRQPLTNNLIRRLVKSVVGRYRQTRQQQPPPSPPLADAYAANRLDELDARTLEEFLISGMAVNRVSFERRPAAGVAGEPRLWVDPVSPEAFFINAVTDPRGFDTELVGCLHDWSLAEVVMRFAGGDRQRALRLRRLYADLDAEALSPLADGSALSFSHSQSGRCRVVEVWTLECREVLRVHDRLEATFSLRPASEARNIERLAARRRRRGLPEVDVRWDVAPAWHCRYFAPDGSLLWHGPSPFPSGAHPFAVKLYPLIDGEIHSLVEDVIDQQKYVNRLINLMDNMMGTAAKGALLFPEECNVEGMDWHKVMRMWAEPGAVIPYRAFGNAEPHQVSTPMADIGARELLQTEISLFEDVSGVSEALMGKPTGGNVGVERYESQVRNASISILDLMATFDDFVSLRNSLLLNGAF